MSKILKEGREYGRTMIIYACDGCGKEIKYRRKVRTAVLCGKCKAKVQMKKKFPELENYMEQDGNILYWDMGWKGYPGMDVPPEDDCWQVVFEVDGQKYACYMLAWDEEQVCYLFFINNPNISYSMVQFMERV